MTYNDTVTKLRLYNLSYLGKHFCLPRRPAVVDWLQWIDRVAAATVDLAIPGIPGSMMQICHDVESWLFIRQATG